MSESIAIKEGGIARVFTADKLKTKLQTTGSAQWVRRDSVQVGTKYITEPGEYNAKDDGLYAYSQVEVNIVNAAPVVGTGPGGQTQTVTVDEDGNLQYEDTPMADAVSIAVTQLPNVLVYGDNAIIGFDGIEVTAYDEGDTSIGVIPFEELIFPVTTSEYGSGTSTYTDEYGEYLPMMIGNTVQYEADPVNNPNWKYLQIGIYDAQAEVFAWSDGTAAGVWIFQSNEPFIIQEYSKRNLTDSWKTTTHQSVSGVVEIEGIPFTYHYTYIQAFNMYPGAPVSSAGIPNVNLFNAIVGHTQEIPVQWNRPGDGATLETSYNITVVPVSPNYNNEESES